jgi:phage terminase large subunit
VPTPCTSTANSGFVVCNAIVPHDARAKELGTGKSRLEVLEMLGLRNLTLAPAHRIEDGINAVRMFLPKCWFDAQKCARGIDALKLYRSEYDDKRQVLRARPVRPMQRTRSATSP